MRRPHGAVGVGRPDRSVSMVQDLDRAAELMEELESIANRIPPGSFTQDPGMRAGDEFTDVGSAGYRENAKRVAERGGAKEYATSVEEEEEQRQAEQKREWTARVLAALVGGSALSSGIHRMSTNPRAMGLANARNVGPVGPGQFAAYNPPALSQTVGGGIGGIAAGAGPAADALERLKERQGWPPYDAGDPRRGPSGPRRRGGR